jgi:hypothetical protein
MTNQAISYTRRSGQTRPIGARFDIMGEDYLGVPGWVWGAGLGTAALYGAYQLTKGPEKPKGALEPESKPWLYKVNPSYWLKSSREKKFTQIEKERGVRNVELQKELSAAERAYAVHQAAAEKAGKVEKLEKEMTTTSGESRSSRERPPQEFVGADPMDTKTQDARALAVLKKSRVPMDPGSTWSPEQLSLANQVVGSVLGAGTRREIWLKEFLKKNEISWADDKGVIYSFGQGRIMRTPPISLASKESVLGDEVGFAFGLAAMAAGIAAPLLYKGGKALYKKIKGKKKSPEDQRQARMIAAYQRKAAALTKTKAIEKRHLAALAVKESERDIAEAEAQALESEAALQTAQAIALEAEATKDVPEIAEDLSGWAVMGGCPWMTAGPAHVAATNTIAGAALRRGLAAARAARTNPEAREVLMGIAVKAKRGDVKSQQLMGTMKAGVAAERQLLATHDSNLAAKENIVRKSWARVAQLKSKAKSGVSGASFPSIQQTSPQLLWKLILKYNKYNPNAIIALCQDIYENAPKPTTSASSAIISLIANEISFAYGASALSPQKLYNAFLEGYRRVNLLTTYDFRLQDFLEDVRKGTQFGMKLKPATSDYINSVHSLILLYSRTGVSGSACGAEKKKIKGAPSQVSPEIPSSIPGEPPDVQVAIAAAAKSMGVPPAVAGSVIAAAHAGDKNAQKELNQAEEVYRAAQRGDPMAKKAMAKVVADAKGGYAPAAQKAAVMAAAVGTLKGRAMWQSRKTKELKDDNLTKKNRAITQMEYRILSIKLSRYLVGNGPLSASEASRGLLLAYHMKLNDKAQRTWFEAVKSLDKPRRKFPKFFALGAGLGIFSDMEIPYSPEPRNLG